MRFRFLLLLLFCSALGAKAQVWTDASSLPLHGKAVDSTVTRYSRLPAQLKDECRPQVWELGQNSAGLYIRFRTDSPSLWVKWETINPYNMNHMSPTGIRGLDLYVRSGSTWRFLSSAKPDLKAPVPITERLLVGHMTPQMREYMLYLSLYDGVKEIQIGTEEGYAVLSPELASPRTGHPVVMYGTSITQGGCVSRPGMVYTSIMGRELDREFVNLGFSGNGIFDLEIARLMAAVPEPSCFVIANVENAHVEHIQERGEAFFRILRDAHPDVPVLFVQAIRFSGHYLDQEGAAGMEARMEAFRHLYDSLRKAGEKKIRFADPGADPAFADAESTVDGVHLTDLGAMRFAKALLPVLKKVLR